MTDHSAASGQISKPRILIATIIFIGGFFSFTLIPLVTASSLGDGLKATITGLLVFGIPEVAMLAAVAIAGKEGFELIKQKLLKVVQVISPDKVSKSRYTLGLVMFTIPIIFGFFSPYINPLFEAYSENRLLYNLIFDIMFVTSIFILGGNFWDKLRSLFIYSSSAQFKDEKN